MFFRCCSLEELSLFAIDWKFWYLKTLQEPSCLYIHFTWICKIKVLSVYGHINLQGQPRTNTAVDKLGKAVQTNWKSNVIVSSFAWGWESRGPRNVDRLKSIGSSSKQSDSKGFVLIAPNCPEEQRLSPPVRRCLRLEASSAASEKLSVDTMTFLEGRNFVNSSHLFALTESLAVNWLNHLKWFTSKDFCLLVSFSANGGTKSL